MPVYCIGACTSPAPTSSGSLPGAKPSNVAPPINLDCNRIGVRLPCEMSFCAHSAATPATCGVAILVPLICWVPPPGAALTTCTPGAATAAFVFENEAMVNPLAPLPSAPTATMPAAAAGGATPISNGGELVRPLSLPLAATTRGCPGAALRNCARVSKSFTLAV